MLRPLFTITTMMLMATTAIAEEPQVLLDDVQVNLIDRVLIPAREAGVVADVLVRTGDYVREGDLLARMDDTLVRVQKEAAEAETRLAEMASENDVDLRFAKKSQAFAQAEFQRNLDASGSFAKSVSGSELDQARLAAERATLAAEQAERDLEANAVKLHLQTRQQKLLEKRLEAMQITAPTDGVIVELFPQAGSWVAAGAPVARIIRLDQLRVEGFVDGRQFDRSLLGSPVQLTVSLPPGDRATVFTGEITFVSPEVNPVTGQIRIWADILNPEFRLRPGTRGQLAIAFANMSPTTAHRDSGTEER